MVSARFAHDAAVCCSGGTAGESFTIDVSDYINNVLNGRTDSRTHAAFAVVRLYRRNSEGGGTYGYSGDSLGSNNVVRPSLLSTPRQHTATSLGLKCPGYHMRPISSGFRVLSLNTRRSFPQIFVSKEGGQSGPRLTVYHT